MASLSQAPRRARITDQDFYTAMQAIGESRGVTMTSLKNYFQQATNKFENRPAHEVKVEVVRAVNRCVNNSLLKREGNRLVLGQVPVAVNMVDKKKCCSKKRKSDCRRCHQIRRVLPKREKCPRYKKIMLRVKNRSTHRMVRRKPGGSKGKGSKKTRSCSRGRK